MRIQVGLASVWHDLHSKPNSIPITFHFVMQPMKQKLTVFLRTHRAQCTRPNTGIQKPLRTHVIHPKRMRTRKRMECIFIGFKLIFLYDFFFFAVCVCSFLTSDLIIIFRSVCCCHFVVHSLKLLPDSILVAIIVCDYCHHMMNSLILLLLFIWSFGG